MISRRRAVTAVLALATALLPASLLPRPIESMGAAALSAQQTAPAQPPADSLFAALHWRSIGPFRGGRAKGITGVPGQPNTFYMGVVNGGVWKTDDAGRTWQPIFDREPTGSIGDVEVAASDPNVVYVASGEGLHRPDLSTGDGVYKSTDAGKTWTHLGLRDGQQIPRIAVDPKNPNRLFVAVLGHPYGPNEQRGVFRSTDGGQTFQKVFYIDENTGASDVEIDPQNPDVVYACMWEAREGPWENAAWQGTKGGIFKSTDGGTTWNKLTAGLPSGDSAVTQAAVTISASNPNRLYATVAMGRAVGIYRSDDAGAHWTQITHDPRPARRIGGGDLPVPTVDPTNPDVVYVGSVVLWKSSDGGRTWMALKGAPGGDDYQRVWVSPDNPQILASAADQGVIISVNGGQTWSSWYNQPTAQLYHVAADNQFPYSLYSGQQESGSVGIQTRSNDGEITFRDWHPVGVDEYGYAAPDPLNPDLVYGGRNVTRYNKVTGQREVVGPAATGDVQVRTVRTAPVMFSPTNPHVLYFAGNTLWKTSDGGGHWTQISPDLSRKTWQVPASVGIFSSEPSAKPTQRGVIYTIAPSPVDSMTIWAGTDDGTIHVTRDGGKTWQDVTPPQLVPWAKVSIMDAGHHDANTAYAAVNTLRLDDLKPYIYRTHDGGKTWTEISNGIPDGETVNVVRQDPDRKDLLFAGTERATYVSFDDGDHWESLRLNMPATSVRDLIIHDNDLIVATHGRGFWILDDMTPIREMTDKVADEDAHLFQPETATRVRWDTNTDTPLPADEPAAENPPDGAVIDYWLKSDVQGPVTLEILGAGGEMRGRPERGERGEGGEVGEGGEGGEGMMMGGGPAFFGGGQQQGGPVIRRYVSGHLIGFTDSATLDVPTYWLRAPQEISTKAGLHRFVWDLHYTPLPGGRNSLPIAAVPHNTVVPPNSPWVAPGTYTVRLTVNGKSYTQPITVRMDPRIKTPPTALRQQATLSMEMYRGAMRVQGSIGMLHRVQGEVKDRIGKAHGPLADSLKAFNTRADSVIGPSRGGFFFGGGEPGNEETLNAAYRSLSMMMSRLEASDLAPMDRLVAASVTQQATLQAVMSKVMQLMGPDLESLNKQLKKAKLEEIQAGGEERGRPRGRGRR